MVRRPNSDPLQFLEKLSPAELNRLFEETKESYRKKARADFYEPYISRALEDMARRDEPDEWAIALRNVKARREHVAKLVAEAIEKNQKARRHKKLHRKLKLSKFHIALFSAAGLTAVQEKYLRLRLEYGLGPSAIARKFGVHPSTVQESLRTARTKIDRASSNPQNAQLLVPYRKMS